jgi:[acyl-carrier-protein] S-malonyltransferase
MMADAAAQLGQALSNCQIAEPSEIKTIANINADYYESSQQISEGLIKQLTCPILWQKCMERLLSEDIEKFYEIGPGRVLTGLMKRINRKTKVINLSSLQSLENFINPNPES